MLLGYYLRYTHFFDLSLLKRMSTFTFRFGISAMMFRNVYTLSDLSEIRVDMMCFILICCVAITAVGWAEAMLFTQQRSRRGVMIQNSFRSNFPSLESFWPPLWEGRRAAASPPACRPRPSSILMLSLSCA